MTMQPWFVVYCFTPSPPKLHIAPNIPLALLTRLFAAIPTMPLSSVGVRAGADADGGVITAVPGDTTLFGDDGKVDLFGVEAGLTELAAADDDDGGGD